MGEAAVRDLSVALYALLFSLVSLRALFAWRARRETASLWFSASFGILAVVVLTSLAFTGADPDDAPPIWVTRIIVALLAFYPISLIEFANTFDLVSRVERRLVHVWFGLLALAALTVINFPDPGEVGSALSIAYSAAFVLGWIAVSLRVVVSMFILGRHRNGIARGRMKLLALGYVLLDVSLLVQALDPEGNLRTLVAVIAAASAVSSALGFAPPGWLRSIMRRSDDAELRRAVAQLASATTERDVLEALLPATQSVLGAPEVALVRLDDEAASTVSAGYSEADLAQIHQEVPQVELPDGRRYVQANGRIYAEAPAAWIVVQAPRAGSFLGVDEFEIMGSIDAIVQLALARIRDAASVRDHEQLLQTAVDLAGLGKWRWTVGEDEVWWSPRMHEIFGTDPAEPMTYEHYRSLIAPEERDRLATIIDYAVKHEIPYEVEHRIVRANGDQLWLHSRGKVLPADEHAPKRVIGITSDVTARVMRERELQDAIDGMRAAERKLRTHEGP